MPKVSIITPSYNSELFISETILSIQSQTFTDWELIITDDCSSDDTVRIIKSFIKKDDRIRLYILKSNQGAGVARNHSIKMAKGRYIAFCDSDDQWKESKLRKQIDFMITNDLSFTYSSYDVIDEENNKLKSIYSPTKLSYIEMLRNNYVGCLTAIYDQDKIGKIYILYVKDSQEEKWLNSSVKNLKNVTWE